MEDDAVARVSQRICAHMNTDHAGAVEHMVMYYAELPRLPRWSKMEAITSTHMLLRYTPTTQTGPIQDYEALPVITVPFNPPLETTQQARARLVELSKLCEDANNHFAQQDVWDKYNVDVLFQRIQQFVHDPVTWAVYLALLFVAWRPWHLTRVLWLQALLRQLLMPLRGIGLFLGVCLVCDFVSFAGRRWTNVAACPTEPLAWPAWIARMLWAPALPPLDHEAWKKETVIITGGARGLGAMLAQRIAQRGAKVITLDVAKTTVKHPNLSAYHCDVSKKTNVVSVARNILYRHGTPTMLINNAGIRQGLPILQLDSDAISRYVGFWLLKEFLPGMVAAKRGHVVSIASIMGHAADYVASKHAIVGLHESLRFELDAIYKTPLVRTTLVTTGHLQETTMFSGIEYNKFARFVAPAVRAERVVDGIVDALECQESRNIALPWYAGWTPALRLLPSFVHDAVQAVRTQHLHAGFGR